MKYPTVAQIVTDQLRKRILEGDLEPGARLTEAQLAEDLDVSQTPVRDAFRRLADEGLIELVPRTGAYVKELTVQKAIEMSELREALEALAFRTLAPHVTADDLEELARLHRDIYQSAIEEDARGTITMDIAFHDYVARRAGNGMLADFLSRLSVLRVCLYITRHSNYPLILHGEQTSHLRLVEALATRDPDIAGNAIRHHLQAAHQEFAKSLAEAEEHPDVTPTHAQVAS